MRPVLAALSARSASNLVSGESDLRASPVGVVVDEQARGPDHVQGERLRATDDSGAVADRGPHVVESLRRQDHQGDRGERKPASDTRNPPARTPGY